MAVRNQGDRYDEIRDKNGYGTTVMTGKLEVTNVGANHDLMQLFDEAVPEPDML